MNKRTSYQKKNTTNKSMIKERTKKNLRNLINEIETSNSANYIERQTQPRETSRFGNRSLFSFPYYNESFHMPSCARADSFRQIANLKIFFRSFPSYWPKTRQKIVEPFFFSSHICKWKSVIFLRLPNLRGNACNSSSKVFILRNQ